MDDGEMIEQAPGLAESVVGYLGGEFGKAGKDIAAKAIGAGKDKLLSWLKAKFAGGAREAIVADFEAEPANPGAAKMLKTAIETRLEEDAALMPELRVLLKELGVAAGTSQTINQIGDGNQSAQVSGDGNTVNMSRRD